MAKTHPVLQQHGFTIKTPPLVEFVQTFSRLLDGGEMSMVFYGRQRYGKSSARRYLVQRIQATRGMVVVWASVQRDVTKSLARDRLYREFLRAPDQEATIYSRNPYDTLVKYLRVQADELETDKVVLCTDEAQNLTLEQLGDLKKLVDDLIDYRLSPFVVLSAQPEILLRPERLRKFFKEDIIDRFFTQVHRFRGVMPSEVPDILGFYDNEQWESKTYSEHFAPVLWKEGWRLRSHAGAFVDAFADLNKALSTDTQEIGMKYLGKAVRMFLLAILQGAQSADAQRDALTAAVRDCGLREAWVAVGDSVRRAENAREDNKKARLKETEA